MSDTDECLEPLNHSRAKCSFDLWVFICCVLLYVVGATVGIQGSDSSEFVLAAISDVRVHPPGYPVLVLWLRCFQWISDNPIWNAAFATVILSSLSMGLLASTLRHWTSSRAISLWVVSLLGVQPLWLRYSTIPEAFSILALVYSMLLWISVLPVRRSSAVWMGLSLTVGIGSHHLFVLALPLILWNAWHLRRWWLIQGVGVMVGFLSYGLLLVQNGGWGVVSNVEDLFRFFVRIDYGTFQITHTDLQGQWWETPLQYLIDWGRDSWGIFPIALLVSLLSVRRFGRESLIGLSWLLCSLFALSLFGLPTTHAYLVHSNRFFMAPSVLALPLIIIGVQSIWERWRHLSRYAFVAWGIPLILISQNFIMMGRFDTRMQDWLEYSCSVLPEESLVFVAGDGAVFGMQLGQQIVEECAHIDVVFPKLLGYEWYRAEIATKDVVGTSMQDIIQHQPLERPIFSVLGLSTQSGLPSSYPYAGVWMRYVPSSDMLPIPNDLMRELTTFQQHYPKGFWTDPFFQERSAERWPSEQWAHSWWSLSDKLESEGHIDSAKMAHQYGQMWLPE